MRTFAFRFHARGNHGMVTSAEIFARQVDATGVYASMTPHFGAAKAGEPITVDVRISANPIMEVHPIIAPDMIIVSDQTLLALPEVRAGLSEETVVLLNSRMLPSYLACEYGLAHVAALDATGIALAAVGRPYPNIALLGALVRLTQNGIVPKGGFPLEVARAVHEHFGGGSRLLATSNLRAFEQGYDRVQRSDTAAAPSAPRVPHSVSRARASELSFGASLARLSEAFVPTTGAWSTAQPIVDMDKCEHCLFCWPLCPDKAIAVSAEGKLTGIDHDACKGCGICAAVCPPKFSAITMKEKLE